MKLLILFFHFLFFSGLFAQEISFPLLAHDFSVDSKNTWYLMARNPYQIYSSKDFGKTWDKFYPAGKADSEGDYLYDFRSSDLGSFLVSQRNGSVFLSTFEKGELKELFRARSYFKTFYTSDSIFVYTDPHFVMRSQNFGKSWDMIRLGWKLNTPDTLQFIYNRKSGAVFTLIDGQLHGLEKKGSAFSLVSNSPKNLLAFANLSDEVLLCQDNEFKYHLFSFQTNKWESTLKGAGHLLSISAGPFGGAIEMVITPFPTRYKLLQYVDGQLTTSPAPALDGKRFSSFSALPSGEEFLALTGAKVFTLAFPVTVHLQVTGEGIIKIDDPKSGDLLEIDRKRTIADFCARGAEIELTAEPEKGYRFVKWVGVPDGEKNQATLKMKVSTGQLNIEAIFEKTP